MAVPLAPSMGWPASSLRSMIARRRWASPACPRADCHTPAPSGPRWAISRLITPRRDLSRVSPSPFRSTMPASPHKVSGSFGQILELLDSPIGLFHELAIQVKAETSAEQPAGHRSRQVSQNRLSANVLGRDVAAGELASQKRQLSPGHKFGLRRAASGRSEEHTSELQSIMRISYAVFCLKKKTLQSIHN